MCHNVACKISVRHPFLNARSNVNRDRRMEIMGLVRGLMYMNGENMAAELIVMRISELDREGERERE